MIKENNLFYHSQSSCPFVIRMTFTQEKEEEEAHLHLTDEKAALESQ